MSDTNGDDLLARVVAIIDRADVEQDLNEADDDDDSTAVDIDYDAYQDIHKLLREAGKLRQS